MTGDSGFGLSTGPGINTESKGDIYSSSSASAASPTKTKSSSGESPAAESDLEIDWKKLGNEAFSRGDYKRAIECYTNGIDYHPRNAALFSNRSAAYLKSEDYRKAKRDAEMCIEIDATWPKGWWRKGQALLEQEEYEEAVKTYEEGLKHCNNDENLVLGRRRAQKFLEISQAHMRGLPIDDASDLADTSRGRAAAFMSAIDSQNKFPSKPGAAATTNGRHNDKSTTEKGEAGSRKTSRPKFPGSQHEEIRRIRNAPNYYAVLHVSPDSTGAEMKKNYHTLARLLHPDKCQMEGADDAMKDVVQAYDTLTNSIKKTLYDQYMNERGDSPTGEHQTYAEWEARQLPVDMPKWLRWLLGIKGCGWVLTIMLLILAVPLILVCVVALAIVWIICTPYRLILRYCFPEKYEKLVRDIEKEREKMEEEQQDRMHAHL